MDFKKIHNVYLVGIGGIGMSALARYFVTQGKFVAGYDKTATPLTSQLIAEGIDVHFEDNLNLVPQQILSQKEASLIIYTPAVPNYHYEFNYFNERGYIVLKRAEVLGFIFSNRKGIAVAGTHGKTTTSTMLAHLLKQSNIGCSAFLGGISKNYASNLLLSADSDIVVAEADEFDRSFLRLYPQLAIVTSVDADHLDIYNTHDEVVKSFNQFIRQINDTGILIYKKGIGLDTASLSNISLYTYSLNGDADFYPLHICIDNGLYCFDVQTPLGIITNVKLGIPGKMNLENAIAAMAAALLLHVHPDEIRAALASFSGVSRRFEYHIRTDGFVYIDDYAHHPEEIKACIASVRDIYPGKKITGIFQPHLFTRTRDFAEGFGESLSMLDDLLLLDIYPAREEPIPGITSQVIFDNVTLAQKALCKKEDVAGMLKNKSPEVLLTMGAGDIDQLVGVLKKMYA